MSESQQQAIDRWKARAGGTLQAIDAKFAGRSFTAAEIFPEIDRAWQIATEASNIARDSWGIDESGIESIAVDLLELRAFFSNTATGKNAAAGYPANYVFVPHSTYWTRALKLERAPVEWILSISVPELEKAARFDDTVNALSNIPSATIRWTLEQLLKGLGVPAWTLPAIGGLAVVGAGTWAYLTFLAPTTRAYRRLKPRHSNPHRKKRRHA